MARNAILNVRSGPKVSFDMHAYQSFVVGLKIFWSKDIYQAVVQQAQALGLDDPNEIEKRMQDSTLYQYFGWLEHHLQQFKYVGHWGLLTVFEQQVPALADYLKTYAKRSPERLKLDPRLPFPDYYRLGDFHQIPGGLWNTAGAFAYELGTQTTTPMMANDADLHLRYARFVKENCRPKKLLDQGCGFGKTTLPLKRENPEAEVTGCDFSAPALNIGHARALNEKLVVNFVQCAAERMTPFADGRFDTITGSMMLHEMPVGAIRQSFKEARRVLQKGGTYTQLDFYDPPGGAVGNFIYYGHSARNREPYMVPLVKLDLVKELEKAGFTDVRVEPFEESEGALAKGRDIPDSWRFPWALIVAKAA
ncbi:MAG: class I SAM-dependent methyltransferase [Alphaproteobacteria bacterium]|nr:class I SAM-dependent methyltransferase [Alphaproteobacteria bacterium]